MLGRYARAFLIVLLRKPIQNPRMLLCLRVSCSEFLNARFPFGIGIHLPKYVTSVIDAGFICSNVCGLNIAMAPIIVPNRRSLCTSSHGCTKASCVANKGSNKAPLLSAFPGSVFLTPLRIFRKNCVLYLYSSHPSSINRLFTWVS